MTLTHHIICDQFALKEFVDWLPELQPNEKYFLCLQARKKYMPSLKSSDKTQLKRFVSSKKNLIEKIHQLECPVGCYKTKEGEIITDEGIALYITLNPRNMLDATYSSIKSLVDLLHHKQPNYDLNPHNEVLSCIHKSKSRTVYVHFDIDRPVDVTLEVHQNELKEIWTYAKEVVGESAVTLIETRGGCHLLVEVSKVISTSKNWHKKLIDRIKCDQIGDLMIPVVGCNQGGFTPKFWSCPAQRILA